MLLTKCEEAGREGCSKGQCLIRAYVRDMNSSNGTAVNDQLLQAGEETALEPGDVIRLGAKVKNPHLPLIRYQPHPVEAAAEVLEKYAKVSE